MTRPRRGWLVLIAVISALAPPVAAEETRASDPDNGPSGKTEILTAAREVGRLYGSDAVVLEGQLLSHAVHNGSTGDAVVSIGPVEAHTGQRFLALRLETGITYDDREVDAATRLARVWSEIVEPSLRTFRSLTLPGDGVVLTVTYAHRADTGPTGGPSDRPDTVVFRLLLSDVSDLLGGRISGQQLVDRSAPVLNGVASPIVLATPTAAGEPTSH